ncbi:MAG TPA: hypothetical protein VJR29_01195 [bacterium]|nr:hypothetical protein [bacterium]
MSLRGFHLFFIAVSGLLSVFMIVWGIYDFKATGDLMGIGLALLGAAGAVLLTVYFRWFLKKYPKLTPMLVSLFAAGLVLSQGPWAEACGVCYKDPNNPLTKGAIMGVIVLGAIISALLAGIAYIGYSWHRRAKLMHRPL